ncbi:hypothetical protein LOTGIDRAFT_132245 [Lottia gigantea]|uniref:BTB domain-containing protein n=1 Tax=Lottia gigantea TaxID=225164 RepID=V3ZPK4_LOTGI|nr:hypothetical protein LOTGIDRAFT_132245 [Lottia gigantea]ESO84410.1 hypothetical protein LOTGIDRAFT_132245 [Lottia gigantea]
MFYDVVVNVKNQSFKAHKVILSCFSKYFADSFIVSSGKTKHPLEIKLNGITSNAFKIFLEFVYSGVLEMKPEIIGELALAAEFLEINCLKEKTMEFMNSITPDQALVVIETGSIPCTSEIFKTSYETVMEHFGECYDTNAFNYLSLDNVCAILRDDRLVIFTEMDVFWAGLKWIAFHMNERSPFLNKVMECVRFPYLTQAEIFKCLETTDLLRTSDKCKEILIHANWEAFSCEVYDPIEPEKEPEKTPDETEPKFVPSLYYIIYYQFFISADKQMQRYSAKAEQWRFFGQLPAPRHHHAVALLGGSIYLAGKRNMFMRNETATKAVFQYDPEQKSWKLCGPMNSCRMFFKLIALYGMLYAIAGEDDRHQILASAECYNPKTNGWIYVSSMHWPRKGFAATACEGKIYVAGGHGESVGKKVALPILQSVESFDPRSNQ